MGKVDIQQRKQLAGAMIANGSSVNEASRKAGINYRTAMAVRDDVELLSSPEVTELRKNIGAEFLLKSKQALDLIDNEKLEASSADQLARIVDTMHKTYRRETGQSTENISLTAGLARHLDEDE